MKQYESVWHGIPFDGLLAAADGGPADASFYKSFYERFFEKSSRLEPGWLAAKRRLATWIDTEVLGRRALDGPESLAVLSVGAGFGIMEEVWAERGYRLAVQECQALSLQRFLQAHPATTVFIGDARRIEAPDGSFDVVVLSAVDYLYRRREYQALLAEIARLLRTNGTVVMISVSNLPASGVLRSLVKNALRQSRLLFPDELVLWGVKRTVSEHLRLAATCKLHAEGLYAFGKDFEEATALPRSLARWWPLGSDKIGVVWRRL